MTLVAIWQVRGGAAANALAAGAACRRRWCAAFRRRAAGAVFFGLGRAALIAALLVSPLALIAIGKAVGLDGANASSGAQRPRGDLRRSGHLPAPSDYAPLARLPQGARARLHRRRPDDPDGDAAQPCSPRPIHRNSRAMRRCSTCSSAAPSEAGARLAALGVDYVAFCPGAPERHNYAAAAPEGLAAALARGEVPVFSNAFRSRGRISRFTGARH